MFKCDLHHIWYRRAPDPWWPCIYSADVVAQITEGTAFDRHGRPFRRRNYRPGIIALVVMLVATAIIWVVALTRPDNTHQATVCNSPPASTDPGQPKLGTPVGRSSMIDVAPAKLAETKVRVLNASGQGGQAADVASGLRDLGFPQPTAANDPIYTGTRLTCLGQLRFGQSGQAAAAAVWLVAPCAELFQDQRPDDSVDLALGTDFKSLAHSDNIDALLASLRPDATAPPDLSLLSNIHSAAC